MTSPRNASRITSGHSDFSFVRSSIADSNELRPNVTEFGEISICYHCNARVMRSKEKGAWRDFFGVCHGPDGQQASPEIRAKPAPFQTPDGNGERCLQRVLAEGTKPESNTLWATSVLT